MMRSTYLGLVERMLVLSTPHPATQMVNKIYEYIFYSLVQVGMRCVHTNSEPPLVLEEILFMFFILWTSRTKGFVIKTSKAWTNITSRRINKTNSKETIWYV
jgi:hypothetical protein